MRPDARTLDVGEEGKGREGSKASSKSSRCCEASPHAAANSCKTWRTGQTRSRRLGIDDEVRFHKTSLMMMMMMNTTRTLSLLRIFSPALQLG